MQYPTLTLVGVMILAGGLGGSMNYLMASKEDTAGKSFVKSFVLGVGAAFLVPLLLNMISSNLMDMIRGTGTTPGDPLKLLVFVGICLVAAIFSTRFIQTIGDRVLQEVQDAKKKAAEFKKEVAPLVSKFTEQPEAPHPTDNQQPKLEQHEQAILNALANPKYVYRFVTGVAKETGVPLGETEQKLADLTKRGLAGRTVRARDNKVLWFVTTEGQRALSSTKSSSPGSTSEA